MGRARARYEWASFSLSLFRHPASSVSILPVCLLSALPCCPLPQLQRCNEEVTCHVPWPCTHMTMHSFSPTCFLIKRISPSRRIYLTAFFKLYFFTNIIVQTWPCTHIHLYGVLMLIESTLSATGHVHTHTCDHLSTRANEPQRGPHSASPHCCESRTQLHIA